MTSKRALFIGVGLALLFHGVGLVGLLGTGRDKINALTPLHLLLMFGLLVLTEYWSVHEKRKPKEGFTLPFLYFLGIGFAGGMLAEIIGVNTGWLFGDYRYGSVLGWKVLGVPWLLGCNWVIVLYGSMQLVREIFSRFSWKVSRFRLKTSLAAALVATSFDWLMEPVAVRLGYWTWLGDGSIPLFNYMCWFLVSAVLLLLSRNAGFRPSNHFALYLLVIQTVFFLVLRVFL